MIKLGKRSCKLPHIAPDLITIGSMDNDLVSRLLPFLAIVFGIIVGLVAEPVKAWVLRWFEANLARREIYAELGRYIVDLERVHRGLGHDVPTEGTSAADFESTKRICTSRPKFEVIQWYESNRLDLLLYIDRDRGIRRLNRGMVYLYEEVNTPGRSVLGLPALVFDLVEKQERYLNGKLLRNCISAAHAENAALLTSP